MKHNLIRKPSLQMRSSFLNCMKHLREVTSSEIGFEVQRYNVANESYRIEILERLLILRSVYNSLKSDSCDFNLMIKDIYKII